MKKTIENKKKILELIENNGPVSSTEISKYMGISIVSAYNYINNLLKEGSIGKEGIGKNTRYFFWGKTISYSKTERDDIINNAFELIKPVSEINNNLKNIRETLDKYFGYINIKDSTIIYGINAFIARYKDTRTIKVNNEISSEIVNYIQALSEKESGRWDVHNFINIKNSISVNTHSSIERVLCYNLSAVGGSFGFTRKYIEFFYGKQNSDLFLIKRAIEPAIEDIKKYIAKYSVDAVIFVPPTIARPKQFQDVFKKMLGLNLPEILVSKNIPTEGTLIAQKNIVEGEYRIINADSSLHIDYSVDFDNYKHIVILDDIIETGATVNSIANKLGKFGYKGLITAMSIMGVLGNEEKVDLNKF